MTHNCTGESLRCTSSIMRHLFRGDVWFVLLDEQRTLESLVGYTFLNLVPTNHVWPTVRQLAKKAILNDGTIHPRMLSSVYGQSADEIFEIVKSIILASKDVQTTVEKVRIKLQEWHMGLYEKRKDLPISFLRNPYDTGGVSSSSKLLKQGYGEQWYATDHAGDKIETMQAFFDLLMSNEAETCTICMRRLFPNEANVTRIECGHAYHAYETMQCLGVHQWIRSNHACPMCRRSVNAR
jgi:hypothetical protein